MDFMTKQQERTIGKAVCPQPPGFAVQFASREPSIPLRVGRDLFPRATVSAKNENVLLAVQPEHSVELLPPRASPTGPLRLELDEGMRVRAEQPSCVLLVQRRLERNAKRIQLKIGRAYPAVGVDHERSCRQWKGAAEHRHSHRVQVESRFTARWVDGIQVAVLVVRRDRVTSPSIEGTCGRYSARGSSTVPVCLPSTLAT